MQPPTTPATISLTLDLSTPEGLAVFARVAAVLGAGTLPDPGIPAAAPAAPATEPARPSRNRKNAAAETVVAAPSPTPEPDAQPAAVEADESMADELARENAEAAAKAAKAAAAAEAPAFDREAAVADVKKVVNAHVAKHGVPATGKIFARFKAERLGEVKNEDLAALKTALELSLTQPAAADDLTS